MLTPYPIPLTYVDIPSIWSGVDPAMAAWLPAQQRRLAEASSPSPPSLAPPSSPPSPALSPPPFPSSTLPPSVQALLVRVDVVGSNIHPYLQGLPVSCKGLNIPGERSFNTWVLGHSL